MMSNLWVIMCPHSPSSKIIGKPFFPGLTFGAVLMPTVKADYRGRPHPVGIQVIASAGSMEGKSTCYDEFAQPLKRLLDEVSASKSGGGNTVRWLEGRRSHLEV